jgi:hypothetical protein
MFNKQPAGYLYHVLPMFGATETFTKSLLRQSMGAGLGTKAPKCVYNAITQILTTPHDAQQESMLSDVRSLPFFQDINAIKWATSGGKKGKKERTAPEMCFQLSSTQIVQTVHGTNNGKYTKVAKPGVDLGSGNKASAANNSNAEQRPSRLILPMMTPPLMKRVRRGLTMCPPLTKRPHPPLVMRKNNPMDRPDADSPPRAPPFCHGGGNANRDVTWRV